MRRQSSQELEEEELSWDNKDNKKNLEDCIDANLKAISNLKRENNNLIRQKVVNHVQIITNNEKIEKLEKGAEGGQKLMAQLYPNV